MGLPQIFRKSRDDRQEGDGQPERTEGRDGIREPDRKQAYRVVLPDSESDSDAGTPTRNIAKRKAKFSVKRLVVFVVILLVVEALTVAVMAFVHRGSHDRAEKYAGCDVGIHMSVHKGKIIPEQDSSRVKIRCDDGYKLMGSSVIECLPSGHWSETPTCVPKECKKLPVPEHAHLKFQNEASSIIREFKVVCDEGYRLRGNKTVVCQTDETWSAVPVCKPVDCGDPPKIDNGVTSPLEDTTFNNTFHVKCSDGYYLDNGNESITCESDGKWDQLPSCAPVSCGLPITPVHASILDIEGSVFNKSVLFKCHVGYRLQGSPTITCQSTAKWSDYPTCKPVNCGYPPHIANGRIRNLKGTSFNADFVVECNDGYELAGSQTVTCGSEGKWEELPVCEIVSCGLPEIPYNANIIRLGGTVFGETITFKCTTRYRLLGYPTVTCQKNGRWTDNPRCEYISDPCYSNPCYQGHCVATGNSYTCTSGHASGSSAISHEAFTRKFSLLIISFLVLKIFTHF